MVLTLGLPKKINNPESVGLFRILLGRAPVVAVVAEVCEHLLGPSTRRQRCSNVSVARRDTLEILERHIVVAIDCKVNDGVSHLLLCDECSLVHILCHSS